MESKTQRKIVAIFDMILKEHNDLKKFMAGFVKPEPCSCRICEMIRELYLYESENLGK